MSINHLLVNKELDIFAKSITVDDLNIDNDIEAEQIFTKGYSGSALHALDTSFNSYALVSTPRFEGATLYFSECKDAILPAPPSSPGLYEVVNGKSCIITRSGNCVTQKYTFTATFNFAQVGVNGACDLYFILNSINPVDTSTYSITFSGYSISSNGYKQHLISPTIDTKTEAGNTYGILSIKWDKNDATYQPPGVGEVYLFDLQISWLENPIPAPTPP